MSAPTVTLKNNSRIASTTDSRYPGDLSKGNAGSVTVNATHLSLTEGSHLTSSSIIGDSGKPPIGNAGSVIVRGLAGPAQSVLIDGNRSGIFTDTLGAGTGGNISVKANTVTLQNGGRLSAQTSGTEASAIGGTITVNATHAQLHSGATITANSNGMANAGDINIIATDGLTMQNSSIVLQNSRLLAQADRGRGGQIQIRASVFQQDATSVVNADAGRGVNGTVTIQALYAPAGGKIPPLGNRPLQAASLLNQRCAAATGGQFSSFTASGRNSLPAEPGGWLSSPSTLAISQSHGGTMTNIAPRATPAEPRGELPLLSLRQIASAGFLTQGFTSERSTSCRS